MIDTSRRAKSARNTLPAFTPVPRRHNRHDGWTADRQRGFIEALADTGSVRAAAHAVNMTAEGAYHLRRHPEGHEFRKAWEAALKLGVQRLEDVAMERALHGVEVPVYHFGAVVGTRRVYNDRLLMFLLRNRAAKRFTADSWQSSDAVTRGQLEKLKKQWRAEWKEERTLRSQQESEEIILSINAKLDRMAQRRLAAMSPRLRRLHDAYMEAQREEENARRAPALPGPAKKREDYDEDNDQPVE